MKEAIIQYNDTPSGGHLAISWKPLVRCKDCKHGEKVSTFKYYPDVIWCNKYLISHNDDWFCADGEIAK